MQMKCPICHRELRKGKDYYGHILAVHGGKVDAHGAAEKPAAIAILLGHKVELTPEEEEIWDGTHSPGDE